METVFKTDYVHAGDLAGVKDCPKAIGIEELKKWVTRIGKLGHDIVIITSIIDINEKNKMYAIVYSKKLCAYWIIPNDEDIVNAVFNSLNKGEPLPDAVEQVLYENRDLK